MTEITDTQRLEWVRYHPNFHYDFEWRTGEHWIVAYLIGDEAEGRSGPFTGRGTDFNSCIDAFLTGKAERAE